RARDVGDRARHQELRGAELREEDRRGRLGRGVARRDGPAGVPGAGVRMEGLRVQNVFTAYDRADVLQDVSLTVEKGTITCLLGSNGSGKTTLIRSILGLTPPRRGSVLFGDKDLTGLPTHRVVAQGIACIPEGRKVFPRLTVVENLHLGAYLEEDDRVIDQRLERVFAVFPRLAERRDQLAGTMSGGEQAMVSIGRG